MTKYVMKIYIFKTKYINNINVSYLFVPASFAKIPLTDKIFSRIWANDNLFYWNSTFMVEMQEVANILNNSIKKFFCYYRWSLKRDFYLWLNEFSMGYIKTKSW